MQEPALGKADCHQLSHRGDTPSSQHGGLGKCTALGHPQEKQRTGTAVPAAQPEKEEKSFLGRKQGLAFFGFYAGQENETQGNNFLSLLTGFFTLFASLQNKAHHSFRTARSLDKRHWFHHWRLIHMPVLALSGSFSDFQLNSHHTANRKRDWRDGNNIYLGDSHYQHQQTPSL